MSTRNYVRDKYVTGIVSRKCGKCCVDSVSLSDEKV